MECTPQVPAWVEGDEPLHACTCTARKSQSRGGGIGTKGNCVGSCCSFSPYGWLSGAWTGFSIPNNVKRHPTEWKGCEMVLVQGNQLKGRGFSMWKEQVINFYITGEIDAHASVFELRKTNYGKFNNTTLFSGHLDCTRHELSGTFTGGTLRLTKCDSNKKVAMPQSSQAALVQRTVVLPSPVPLPLLDASASHTEHIEQIERKNHSLINHSNLNNNNNNHNHKHIPPFTPPDVSPAMHRRSDDRKHTQQQAMHDTYPEPPLISSRPSSSRATPSSSAASSSPPMPLPVFGNEQQGSDAGGSTIPSRVSSLTSREGEERNRENDDDNDDDDNSSVCSESVEGERGELPRSSKTCEGGGTGDTQPVLHAVAFAGPTIDVLLSGVWIGRSECYKDTGVTTTLWKNAWMTFSISGTRLDHLNTLLSEGPLQGGSSPHLLAPNSRTSSEEKRKATLYNERQSAIMKGFDEGGDGNVPGDVLGCSSDGGSGSGDNGDDNADVLPEPPLLHPISYGVVSGGGESHWKGRIIPFVVSGTFKYDTVREYCVCDITKAHRGGYTNVVSYSNLCLDMREGRTFMGTYEPNGHITLDLVRPFTGTTEQAFMSGPRRYSDVVRDESPHLRIKTIRAEEDTADYLLNDPTPTNNGVPPSYEGRVSAPSAPSSSSSSSSSSSFSFDVPLPLPLPPQQQQVSFSPYSHTPGPSAHVTKVTPPPPAYEASVLSPRSQPQQSSSSSSSSLQPRPPQDPAREQMRLMYSLFLEGLCSSPPLTPEQVAKMHMFREKYRVSDADHDIVLERIGLTPSMLVAPERSAFASGEGEGDANDSDAHLCKVCFERETDCVLHPCGHLAICLQCSKQLTECPICRVPIQSAQAVYRS